MQGLDVDLVDPAEVVEDLGFGTAGLGVPNVVGELEIVDDGAVLVEAGGGSDVHV